MARERDEGGKYVETVRHEDIMGVFDEVDGPVITSSDVSVALDCTTEAARRKLSDLVESGQLGQRKTPARTVVYWQTGETPAHSVADDEEPIGTLQSASEQPIGSDDLDAVADVLADWPAPTKEKREQKRRAARAAIEYLAQQGEAQAKHIKSDVEPEQPIEGQSADTWWDESVREGFYYVRDNTGLIELNGRTWYWLGDD